MLPLIGFNKQEIIAVARTIGTYHLSTEPYKDCCALIGQNPKTRSYPDQLQRMEARLLPDYQQLIAATLADTVCLEYDCGELSRAPRLIGDRLQTRLKQLLPYNGSSSLEIMKITGCADTK